MEITKINRWVRQLINDVARIDGHDTVQFDSSFVFKVSEDFPDPDTFIVYKNGVDLTEANWAFNADTNEVTIDIVTSGDDLVKDDVIEISFNYFAKYSDNEINGFIEGSLLFFTEFRYPKTFDVDTEIENVIVLEGEDVTQEEGHIIALVTAININPDNVNLRTPDITRSAVQNKSKKDQIAETITRWQRFVGKLSFLEDTNSDNNCGC